MKYLTVIVLMLGLQGCASTVKIDKSLISEESATVIVFFDGAFGSVQVPVLVDGNKVGSVGVNQLRFEVTPGQHTIATDMKLSLLYNKSSTIIFNAGEIYMLKVVNQYNYLSTDLMFLDRVFNVNSYEVVR